MGELAPVDREMRLAYHRRWKAARTIEQKAINSEKQKALSKDPSFKAKAAEKAKIRNASLTEEQKARRSNRANERYASRTPAQKAEMSRKAKEKYHNLTDAEKSERHKRCNAAEKRRVEAMNESELLARRAHEKVRRDTSKANLTEADKEMHRERGKTYKAKARKNPLRRERKRISDKKWKDGLSAEDRKLRSDKQRSYYEAITPDQKRARAEYQLRYTKKRQSEDHSYAMHRRLRCALNTWMRRGGYKKTGRTLEYIGCSMVEFVAHIESQFLPDMNWLNRSEWHIDHIIPVVDFFSLGEAGAKVCHHFSNLRPLWDVKNWKKSDRLTFADWSIVAGRAPKEFLPIIESLKPSIAA